MGQLVATQRYYERSVTQMKRIVEKLQDEIKRVTMMTKRKKQILVALHSAFEYCGYDLDAFMGTKCRERTITDLRSIAWTIYQDSTRYSAQQIALDFGWNRCTIFCSIKRARELRELDRNFADMFDSVHGAFINALAMAEGDNGSELKS